MMHRKINKFIILMVVLTLLFSCKKEVYTTNDIPNDKNIVILFTGSTRGKPNGTISYNDIMQYKKDLKKENYVILVDAGDFLSENQDEAMIKENIANMKSVEYDFCVLGENEFNYGIDNIIQMNKQLKNKIFCMNFYYMNKSDSVLLPYKVFNLGNKRLALIGVSSPEILFNNKKVFRDENNEQIYTMLEDNAGIKLCSALQDMIYDLKEKGINYIVLVSHLGDKHFSKTFDYATIIGSTNGIDAIIDGHSKENLLKYLTNNEGKEVLLAQVEPELASIGSITIKKNSAFSAECKDNISSH